MYTGRRGWAQVNTEDDLAESHHKPVLNGLAAAMAMSPGVIGRGGGGQWQMTGRVFKDAKREHRDNKWVGAIEEKTRHEATTKVIVLNLKGELEALLAERDKYNPKHTASPRRVISRIVGKKDINWPEELLSIAGHKNAKLVGQILNLRHKKLDLEHRMGNHIKQRGEAGDKATILKELTVQRCVAPSLANGKLECPDGWPAVIISQALRSARKYYKYTQSAFWMHAHNHIARRMAALKALVPEVGESLRNGVKLRMGAAAAYIVLMGNQDTPPESFGHGAAVTNWKGDSVKTVVDGWLAEGEVAGRSTYEKEVADKMKVALKRDPTAQEVLSWIRQNGRECAIGPNRFAYSDALADSKMQELAMEETAVLVAPLNAARMTWQDLINKTCLALHPFLSKEVERHFGAGKRSRSEEFNKLRNMYCRLMVIQRWRQLRKCLVENRWDDIHYYPLELDGANFCVPQLVSQWWLQRYPFQGATFYPRNLGAVIYTANRGSTDLKPRDQPTDAG